MDCKDCFHYEACKFYTDKTKFNLPKNAENCSDFKDKSKIVELPCKVGDTVWYIAFGRIYKGKVHAITFGGRNNVKGGQIHIYDYDKDNASLKLSEFNKSIFFTKEEAEAMLKELKENG